MYTPAERRANIVIIFVSVALAIAAIHTFLNPPRNVRIDESVQGVITEKYVTVGQVLCFGLKEDICDNKTQVEVTKDEFEKYSIGDYFMRVK